MKVLKKRRTKYSIYGYRVYEIEDLRTSLYHLFKHTKKLKKQRFLHFKDCKPLQVTVYVLIHL